MDDRTTSDLITRLGDDVTKCHENLIGAIDQGSIDANGDVLADYEFHARQLIRAIFAFIEGVTFSVKVHAAWYCLSNDRDITDAERHFAADIDHVLTDKGIVIERSAHIRLSDNVRFAFALQEKAVGIDQAFDASVEWWSCFKSSIKVRDRLTHPKLPEDIDVTGGEIVTALKAYNGFKDQVMAYAEKRPDQ